MSKVPNLALFDFDGTITCKDTFTPFIYYAVEPRRLAVGKVVLSPVIAAYKLGLLPATLARASIVRFGFRGTRETDIWQLGTSYAREALSQVIRPQAMDRIIWHKAQGDVVVVVSASLDVYLTEWCNQLGLALISSQLEVRAGILTGRYRQGDCTGKEKSRRILDKYDVQAFPIIYAYGDTEEDADMLNIAHEKYFRWKKVCD